MLGYRDHDDWRDMSEYVVHFTRDTAGASAYDGVMSILSAGVLQARSRFGAARTLDVLGETQQCVCFSEIPLDRLNRLVERRSLYGIGFRQDALTARRGGRVWYVDKGSELQDSMQALIRAAMQGGINPDDAVWHVTPFIDFPGEYGSTMYRFEWEREWRVRGDFSFDPAEVAFLMIPEHLHTAARAFFATARRENLGPAYDTTIFLDPRWPDERLQSAFAQIGET